MLEMIKKYIKFSILYFFIIGTSFWLYYRSTNYYAFIFPHAKPGKSDDPFSPYSYPGSVSKTAEYIPTPVVVISIIFVVVSLIFSIYYFKVLRKKL